MNLYKCIILVEHPTENSQSDSPTSTPPVITQEADETKGNV